MKEDSDAWVIYVRVPRVRVRKIYVSLRDRVMVSEGSWVEQN